MESIFFGKQKGGRGAVGFGDDPQFVARRSAVTAEKTEALLQAEMIFSLVFHWQFAPVAGHMTREEFHCVLSGLFERGQSARRGDEAPRSNNGLLVILCMS